MRDFILKEIARLAVENGGKAPGVATFATATGITQGKWRGVYWARWSDALAEAGLSANEMTSKLDGDWVLEQVAALARNLGRMPTYSDIRLHKRTNSNIPNDKTLAGHFGSAAGLTNALVSFAKRNGDESLANILPEASPVPKERSLTTGEGFVYLLKSGSHFKIGRTDTIARRITEIRTTLPEAVEIIHSIKTDDPSGIEAYWHRRFADKRMNGEWFALSAADIKAFLRRSFQ